MAGHTRSGGAERGQSRSTRVRVWSGALLAVGCIVAAMIDSQATGLSQSPAERAEPALDRQTLTDAQRLFYNAHYEAAAAVTAALRSQDSEDLATDELRTSALLFQLRALLEGRAGKKEVRNCAACPGLIAEFSADILHGQGVARARLSVNPSDEEALYFLGKLNLNYVWLQLGPLKKKTGWGEYWEARHSLDAALRQNPQHIRARVARAWIDYIVDTRLPWGARWLLGGGDRKRALTAVREAAGMDSDFYDHAEAEFALWDMYVRERDLTRAAEVARRLTRDFPDNREVAAFLETTD